MRVATEIPLLSDFTYYAWLGDIYTNKAKCHLEFSGSGQLWRSTLVSGFVDSETFNIWEVSDGHFVQRRCLGVLISNEGSTFSFLSRFDLNSIDNDGTSG